MTARAQAAFGMSRQPGERWTRFATRIANAFGLVLVLVLLTYVLASVTPYSGWTAVLIVVVSSASAAVGLTSAEARPWLVRWGIPLAGVAVRLAMVKPPVGSSVATGANPTLPMRLPV